MQAQLKVQVRGLFRTISDITLYVREDADESLPPEYKCSTIWPLAWHRVPEFSFSHNGHCFLHGRFGGNSEDSQQDGTLRIKIEHTIQIHEVTLAATDVIKDFKSRYNSPFYLQVVIVPTTAAGLVGASKDKEKGKGKGKGKGSWDGKGGKGTYSVEEWGGYTDEDWWIGSSFCGMCMEESKAKEIDIVYFEEEPNVNDDVTCVNSVDMKPSEWPALNSRLVGQWTGVDWPSNIQNGVQKKVQFFESLSVKKVADDETPWNAIVKTWKPKVLNKNQRRAAARKPKSSGIHVIEEDGNDVANVNQSQG